MCPSEEIKEEDLVLEEEDGTPQEVKDMEAELKENLKKDSQEEEDLEEGVDSVEEIPDGQESKYGL